MKHAAVCLKMSTIATALALLAGNVAQAASGTWNSTVAGSNEYWTNSLNWSASPYSINDDTATFNNAGNGRTNINVVGLAAIKYINFDSSAAAYNIGTSPVNSQPLNMRNDANYRMLLTCAKSQVFNTAIQLGPDKAGASYNFQNDNAFNTLTFLGDVSCFTNSGTAGDKTLNLNGVGNIRVLGGVSRGNANNLFVNINGGGANAMTGTNLITVLRMNGGSGSVLDIGNGYTVFTNSNTSSLGGENLTSTFGGTINGTGAFVMTSKPGEDNADNRVDDVNSTLTVNCRLTGYSGFELYSGAGIAGTFALNGVNDFVGNVFMNAAGTISAAKIGNRFSTTSNLGAGYRVRFSSFNLGGPKLKYTGAGETSDRVLEFASHARLEQAGSGLLNFSAPPIVSAACTVTLSGSTAAAGEISGVVSNGTGTIAFAKEGTGTWTLSAANVFTGALTVNGGVLRLTQTNAYTAATAVNGGTLALTGNNGSVPNTSGITLGTGGTLLLDNTPSTNHANRVKDTAVVTLNGGTLLFAHTGGPANYSETLGAVAVSAGASTIAASRAASGQTSTLTLTALTRTSGSVDFAGAGLGTDTRNRILITGQPDGLIGPWATVNGTSLAAYSSTLGIYPASDAAYTDIAARGPSSTIADSAGSNVRINSAGSSGPIDLSAATTTVASLLQNTATDATVATADKTLRVTSVIVPAGKASVTLGAAAGDGTVAPATAGGGLTLANDGAAPLTVNAVIANHTTASALNTAGSGTVTLTAANTFSGATSIGAGSLVLAHSNALQNSTLTLGATGTPVFDSAVAGHAFTLGALSGLRDLALADNASGPVALAVGQNNASTAYSGVLSGDGSLTKQGTGTLTLSGANTFRGGATISAGRVSANHMLALGSGPVANNGTLDLTAAPVTYSGLSVSLSGSGTNNVTMASNLAGGTANFNGDYSGFTGLWNLGVGVGATGSKVVMNGRDNAAAAIVVRTNATLYCSAAMRHSAALTLQGGNTGDSYGQLRLDGNSEWFGPILLAGVITDANDGLLGCASGTGYISGQITDGGVSYPVSKLGGGTLALLGTNNLFSGQLWNRAGTLRASSIRNIGQPSSLGAPTSLTNGLIKLGTGSTSAALAYAGMGDTSDRGIDLASTTATITLDHSGTNLWKMTGAVTNTGAGGKQLRLQGSVTATGELAGVISDYSSAYSNNLFKTGAGAWTLSADNTFKGNVVVDDGALRVTRSEAFGNWPKTVQAANNANGASPHFHLDGTAGDLTIPATITFKTSNSRVGAIFNEGGNNAILGPVQLIGGDGDTILNSVSGKLTVAGSVTAPFDTSRQLRLWGNGDGEISGAIANGLTAALPVYKEQGTGTWTLSGANTYSGITYANNGTLVIGGANGAVAGGVTVGGGTLVISNAPSANSGNRLSNSGAVTLNGGALRFAHPGGAADYGETAGALAVGTGQTTVETSQADAGQTSALTFASLTRTGAGSVNFAGAGLGAADNRNRILFTSAPAPVNGILGPWAMYNGTNFATYDNTLGVIPAGNDIYTDISAKGPSAIPNSATANARINAEGTEGPITLESETANSVYTLMQNTEWAASVGLTNQTLLTSGILIGEGKADLTIGTNTTDGLLMPLTSGGNLLLANYAAGTLTVNVPVTNNGTASSLGKAGPGPVSLNGALGYTGPTVIGEGELTLASASTQTFASVISGDGSLAKDGSGRLALNAANTYNGQTTLRNGTLLVMNNAALGTALNGTVAAAGSTLDVGGSGTAQAINLGGEAIAVSGAGVNGRGAIVNSSNLSQYNAIRYLTLNGDTTFGGEQSGGRWDVRTSDSTKPASFNMNGYTVTKVGSNYVGLTSVPVANPGNVVIAEGMFTLEGSTSLGGGPANVMTVQNGAWFDIYNTAVPVPWSLVMNDGARFFSRGGNSTALNIWAGPAALNGTAWFDTASSTIATLAGDVSGSGSLVKVGSGTLYLTGTNNTYSGGTYVSNNWLYAWSPGSLPSYASPGKVQVANGAALALYGGNGTTGWTGEQLNALHGSGAFVASNSIMAVDTTYGAVSGLGGMNGFALYKYGTNTLTVTGLNTNRTLVAMEYSNLRIYAGTLNLSSTSSNVYGRCYVLPGSGGGTLEINGPTTFTESFYVGNYNGDRSRVFINTNLAAKNMWVGINTIASGAVVQNDGKVEVSPASSGQILDIGRDGAYGYYRLNGGSLKSGQMAFGGGSGTGNNGVYEQFGGDAAVMSTGGWLIWGWVGGNGVANIYSGSLSAPPSGNEVNMAHSADKGAFAMLNLLGNGALLSTVTNSTTRGLNMANTGGNLMSVVNLKAGTLLCNRVFAVSKATPTYFNFNGGTLKANGSTALANTFIQGLTAATVYPGGAVVDTTNATIVLNQSLLAPTGLGVAYIPVAIGGAGYIGAPVVKISGGSGTGATAIAAVDLNPASLTSGQVTGITVTSPGVGYQSGDSVVVTLIGGGFLTVAQTGSVFLSPNTAEGGLTKLGAGTLTLGGTNTYGGVTTIREGTLALAHPDALPTNAAVSVAGGKYDLGGRSVTNSLVTVTEGVIFNGSLTSDGLTKTGPGTLLLSTSPSSTGPIRIEEGTLALPGRMPGLYEGRLAGGFNTTSPNPMTTTALSPRYADLWFNGNAESGGVWIDNSTYVYSGYIWNNTASPVTWSFAKEFDDSTLLKINGTTLINNGSHNTPVVATCTLQPGANAIEMRFGQGSSYVGPKVVSNVWTTVTMGIGYDPLARITTYQAGLSATHQNLVDPGDGSLLTLTNTVGGVTNLLASGSSVQIAANAALDLGGNVQTLADLSGSGMVSNGTLTVTGTLAPGGEGTLGTLTLAANATLSGTLRADVAANGDSDLLVVRGNLDMSGLSLTIANPEELDRSRQYTLVTCSGTRTGTFAAITVPDSRWHAVYQADGSVVLLFVDGTLMLLK